MVQLPVLGSVDLGVRVVCGSRRSCVGFFNDDDDDDDGSTGALVLRVVDRSLPVRQIVSPLQGSGRLRVIELYYNYVI